MCIRHILNKTHVDVYSVPTNGLYVIMSVTLVQTGSAKKNGMKATTSALIVRGGDRLRHVR